MDVMKRRFNSEDFTEYGILARKSPGLLMVITEKHKCIQEMLKVKEFVTN